MPNVVEIAFWLSMIGFPSLPRAGCISEECQLQDLSKITCVCTTSSNEEFLLPEGYNYENVTSIALSSCSSANLHFSSLTEAKRMEEIIVRNISGRLLLELFITSKTLKTLELSNIGIIPLLTHDTFTSLSQIDSLAMRDLTISRFEEEFSDIEITELIMENVTVRRLEGFHFSERGKRLRIKHCDFQKVATTLNFAYFTNVEIVDSKFELQTPGHLSIDSDVVLIASNIFSNVSMNVVATSGITINQTCAVGKSSLRLSSPKIESFGNRLPTEIIYTGNKQQNETITQPFINRNNTVCIAGNCKCPKSNGGNVELALFSMTVLLFFEVFSFNAVTFILLP